MKHKKFDRRGFTLIELLIVIGIIGILSTVATASILNAQAKARDAKRINDVSQLANALRLYYNEYEKFPVNPIPGSPGSTCFYDKDFAQSGNSFYNADCLKELSTSGIMTELPDAPSGGPSSVSTNIVYTYGYHLYGPPSQNPTDLGAVVGTLLETYSEPSSCQFDSGNWCNSAVSGRANRYCICLYY